ncbi:MAG: hypothetical protein WBO34_11420 [Gammaproteobacteria bacterium]
MHVINIIADAGYLAGAESGASGGDLVHHGVDRDPRSVERPHLDEASEAGVISFSAGIAAATHSHGEICHDCHSRAGGYDAVILFFVISVAGF